MKLDTAPERAWNVPTDPSALAELEARNAVRQFALVRRLVEERTDAGDRPPLHPADLREFNRIAVWETLPDPDERPGAYRTRPASISHSPHVCPPPDEVPTLVEQLCGAVAVRDPDRAIEASAYVMWRVNWVHPFPEGNGRTARAAAYLILCLFSGGWIPGRLTIPEQIAQDREPYYAALREADEHWKRGRLDVSRMEALLSDMLERQLRSVIR